MTRCRSSTDTARWAAPRRDGFGGTSLATVTRSRGMRTVPRAVSTVTLGVVDREQGAHGVGQRRAADGVRRLEPPSDHHPRPEGEAAYVARHGPHSMCAMTYVIAQPCVDLKDKACIEECPVDCIYEGERSLYIHPDECVDCGACEPVCPVEAIYYEDDVPEQWAQYYKANVEFFDDLGSPGGAAKLGLINKDHPIIADLPPQEHDE